MKPFVGEQSEAKLSTHNLLFQVLQEQLVDSSTVAAPSTIMDDPPSAITEDSKLDQIRQPYYNQVLQKRIQTLDADREVLRQLNKALVQENQNLKSKNQSQINGSRDLNGICLNFLSCDESRMNNLKAFSKNGFLFF